VSATAQAQDILGNEAYPAVRSYPAEDTVRTVAAMGSPVETLLDVVKRENAGLLVVGNRGLNGIEGRLLGSVPATATPRSQCDVLVVHATD
jgi:nucleotide-binding universal stress UspA family protein